MGGRGCFLSVEKTPSLLTRVTDGNLDCDCGPILNWQGGGGSGLRPFAAACENPGVVALVSRQRRAAAGQNVTIRFIQAVQPPSFFEKIREPSCLQSVKVRRATLDGMGIARCF